MYNPTYFTTVVHWEKNYNICVITIEAALLISGVCQSLSRVHCVTPWTAARQAPLSMGFSRQEYWSGLPFPSPGDLPNPGIKSGSPVLQADSLPLSPREVPIS